MRGRTAREPRVGALDGVRAVAVLAVFAFHAFASGQAPRSLLQLGRFGVTVFFVLSGFLITLRLLALADRADLSAPARWRTFFVHRSARIFPLYYATVAFLVFFGAARRLWPWLVTYSLNLAIASNLLEHGRWLGGPAHLWSLCVEEQFYVLYPLFVLTPLRRWLAPAVFVAALAAVALRVSVASSGDIWAGSAVWVLPFAHLDAFGAGILAALVTRAGPPFARRGARTLYVLGGFSLAACAGLAVAATSSPWSHVIGLMDPTALVATAFFPTALSVLSAAIILAAWRGELGFPGAILSSWPFAALGRISYGVYVFHMLIILALSHNAWPPAFTPLRGLGALSASVALAALSWFVLERPLIERGRKWAAALELRSR